MSTIFQVVAADPPWRFDDKLPGNGRGADKHYATMETEAICSLRLPLIAADALLFLWRVASMQEDALRVCRAWGFRAVSEIVWCKATSDGRPHIGMGRYVRNSHETCLIGARGAAASLIQSKNIPSWFMAARGRHSAKPSVFYTMIERLAPGPYVELFAREPREGWTTIGNALGQTIPFGLFARSPVTP